VIPAADIRPWAGRRPYGAAITAAVAIMVMIIAAREEAARQGQCGKNQRQLCDKKIFHAPEMGHAGCYATKPGVKAR